MALVVLRCSCGLVYRRDEISEKRCPSCGTLNEPDEGRAREMSPSTVRALLVLSLSMLAGLLLVLGALVWRKLSPEPPALSSPDPLAAAPRPLKETPSPAPPPPPSGPIPPPLSKVAEIDPLDAPEIARAYRLVARANLGGLVKAVLRLVDAHEPAARLHATLAAEHEELREIQRRHPRRPELRALPQRVEPDDVVLGFSVTPVDRANPEPFLRAVRAWFRALQPGAASLVSVRRGSNVLSFPIYAPTLDEDIRSLVRLAGTEAGAGGEGERRLERPLSGPLLEEVLRRLDGLHPVYREALDPEMAERIDVLLRRAAGRDEDEHFLRLDVLEQTIRPLEEEYDSLLRASLHHEANALGLLRPDVLHFGDGRRLEVLILEETPERLLVRGQAGEAKLERKALVSVERGQELARQIEKDYAARRDDVPGLLALLPALRPARFKPLRDMVCARILVLDPLHETAWKEIALPRRRPPLSARSEDVVILKDGSRKRGWIAEEDASGLVLESPLSGPNGERLGSTRARVLREAILRIDRMSEEAREKAQARAKALAEARRRDEEAMARYVTEGVEVAGAPGMSIKGEHVELRSTAPERETRAAARALETIFAGFHREFGVPKERTLALLVTDPAAYAKLQGVEPWPHAARFLRREKLLLVLDPSRGPELGRSREAAAREARARAALLHEAFKAFAANALWPGLDDARVPRWAREGFAAYFETATADGGELRHGPASRRHLAAFRAGAAAGVRDVLRAGTEDFAGDPHASAEPSRARAWLVAHWIASRGIDPAALRRYVEATSRGEDPAAALGHVNGLSVPEMEAAVLSHLDRLLETSR